MCGYVHVVFGLRHVALNVHGALTCSISVKVARPRASRVLRALSAGEGVGWRTHVPKYARLSVSELCAISFFYLLYSYCTD